MNEIAIEGRNFNFAVPAPYRGLYGEYVQIFAYSSTHIAPNVERTVNFGAMICEQSPVP